MNKQKLMELIGEYGGLRDDGGTYWNEDRKRAESYMKKATKIFEQISKEIYSTQFLIEPTVEMLKIIAADIWPDDYDAGKEAQRRGINIPPNAEMEIAYGKYKRLIKLLNEEV
jgi:hypothetical protein